MRFDSSKSAVPTIEGQQLHIWVLVSNEQDTKFGRAGYQKPK